MDFFFKMCQLGDTDAVRKLKIKDIDYSNGWQDYTGLMHACTNGHLDTAKYLIARGANVHRKRNSDKTAFHDAVQSGNLTLVKFLYSPDKGMSNLRDSLGMKPVHIACNKGHFEVLKFLVSKGGNIFAEDYRGQTGLHYAANGDKLEMVKYLLSIGLDIDKVDVNGDRPLDLSNGESRGYLEKELQRRYLTTLAKVLHQKVVGTEVSEYICMSNLELLHMRTCNIEDCYYSCDTKEDLTDNEVLQIVSERK